MIKFFSVSYKLIITGKHLFSNSQVIVEGVWGLNYPGYIAIDDFKFKKKRCFTVPVEKSPGEYIFAH